MRWVVVLVLFTACGRCGFDPYGDDTATSDGGGADAAVADACALGPWGTPQPIDAVNTSLEEWSPTLSNDGLELIFQRGGGSGPQADLFLATRATTADSFGAPVAVAELNTANPEAGPWLSDDRRRLYFSVNGTVYRASRSDPQATFSTPELVPGLQATVVRGVTLSADEDEMLYNDNNNDQIFRATLDEMTASFAVVGPLAELGTTSSGFADLARDKLSIVFERGGNAIFEARRATSEGPFATPAAVTNLDSPGNQDGDPDLGDSDRAIVFASTRGGNLHDIYIATRSCQ